MDRTSSLISVIIPKELIQKSSIELGVKLKERILVPFTLKHNKWFELFAIITKLTMLASKVAKKLFPLGFDLMVQV